MMKYMLLIYSAEDAWTEGEREHCYAESIRLTRDLHEKGQYRAPPRSSRSRRRRVCASGTGSGS